VQGTTLRVSGFFFTNVYLKIPLARLLVPLGFIPRNPQIFTIWDLTLPQRLFELPLFGYSRCPVEEPPKLLVLT